MQSLRKAHQPTKTALQVHSSLPTAEQSFVIEWFMGIAESLERDLAQEFANGLSYKNFNSPYSIALGLNK